MRASSQLFDGMGLHFDASSGFEVRRAMAAGVAAHKARAARLSPFSRFAHCERSQIDLSSQELPDFFPELIRAGVGFNACSLSQLERFGSAFPGASCGVRFNPGLGSGGTGKTNVGGARFRPKWGRVLLSL